MPSFQIEMLWRCPACKTEAKGRDKVCPTCRRAKTSAEVDYMPGGEVSYEARVRDEAILRQAEAGADWFCKFCSSSQRKLDGTCEQCGAGQDQAKAHEPIGPISQRTPATPIVLPKARPQARSFRTFSVALAVLTVVAVGWFAVRPVRKTGTVESMHWSRTVGIERHTSHAEEGWTPPLGAEDVRAIGVFPNGTDRVRVGSHLETYVEKVACGEDCVTPPRVCKTTPKTCSKTPIKCEPNRNGFASCKGGDEVCTGGENVCTGGGRTCSPKFCPQTRTKSVDDYRDVPHMQTRYGWRIWSWDPVDTARAEGTVEPPRWPETRPLAPEERLGSRSETYEVVFKVKAQRETFRPSTSEEYRSYAPGQRRTLRISPFGVEVVGP